MKIEHLLCLSSLVCILIIVIIFVKMKADKNNVFRNYYYFDANGTTPIHTSALSTYVDFAYMGNSSADYAKSTGTYDVIKNTSNNIYKYSDLSPKDFKIVYNSGASEGNNFVLQACVVDSKPHYILSSVEHKTSLECAKNLQNLGKIELSLIEPDIDGRIDPINIANAIRPNTKLISIIHIGNETGAINDIKTIGKIAQNAGVFLHIDVVQSFGKNPKCLSDVYFDAATTSFHKFYGPQGLGMIIMSNRFIEFVKHRGGGFGIAGSQNDHLRGGTINIPAIAAASTSMEITFANRAEKNNILLSLKYLLIKSLNKHIPIIPYRHFAGRPDDYIPPGDILTSMGNLEIPNFRISESQNFQEIPGNSQFPNFRIGMIILGPTNNYGYPDIHKSTPNTLLVSFVRFGNYKISERVCNIKIRKYLYDHKCIVSIGSACNTSDPNPSHVLKAIRAPFIVRSGVIRISFNDYNKPSDVEYLTTNLLKAINETTFEQ